MSTANLQSTLIANSAISTFTVQPGPHGPMQAAAIALGDMTRIPCDAFVVPHFQNCASPGGVGGAVARSGASRGWKSYDQYVQGLTGKQPWGEVVVTESGGGNSAHLLNTVTVGAGNVDEELSVVATATSGIMQSANEHGFNRVVFPALGTGVIGKLTPSQSARAILGAVYTFWKDNPESLPREVIITIYGDQAAYRSFSQVLESGVLTPAAAHIGRGEKKVFNPAKWVGDVSLGARTKDWLRGSDPHQDVVPGRNDDIELIRHPPEGMDFSENCYFEDITLITRKQFKKLPDGTVLISIRGNEAVVGRDDISMDTRFGYLSYGFRL